MGMRLSTAGFSSSGRPAPRSTVSGLALLSADEWLDVAPFLDYYNNATLRFTSGALNRLVQRNSFTLPRRVIEVIPVGYKDSTCLLGKQYTGYSAEAYTADLQTTWLDLEFGVHETPEAILLEVLTKCQGLVVTLDLQEFEYNEQVMDVMAQCSPLLTISALWIRGVSYNAGSTHEHVLRILEMPMPGLVEVLFENDEAHPDSAAVLGRCVQRKIPVVTLAYVADVTEAEILDFLFKNSSASTARQFVVQHLERPLPDDFFEMVVERCQRNECKSLYFGMDGILTDPMDAKYNRYVVERNVAEAMYKFESASQNCLPFTIVVGRYRNGFSLRVFQGQMVELYTSLASLRKRITPQTAAKWQCQIM